MRNSTEIALKGVCLFVALLICYEIYMMLKKIFRTWFIKLKFMDYWNIDYKLTSLPRLRCGCDECVLHLGGGKMVISNAVLCKGSDNKKSRELYPSITCDLAIWGENRKFQPESFSRNFARVGIPCFHTEVNTTFFSCMQACSTIFLLEAKASIRHTTFDSSKEKSSIFSCHG